MFSAATSGKTLQVALGLNLPRTTCTIMPSCFGRNYFPLQYIQQLMWGGCMHLGWRIGLPQEDFCVFLCIFLTLKYCLFPSRFPQKSSCLVWLFPLSVLRYESKMKQGRFFFLCVFRVGKDVDYENFSFQKDQ